MRIGFLMDPLDAVRVGHDSTFALMLECARRRFEVRELRQEWLFALNGSAWSRMRTVEVTGRPDDPFSVLADRAAPLGELDVLFLRKDPPVDVEFLHATQLVELNPGPVIVNSPEGLRAANEKLFALRFPDLMPTTLVTREADKLRAFFEAQGGDLVLKPLDGCGGQGVRRVRSLDELGDPDGAVIAQRYLPEVAGGDKRVIVLDGEPVGALLRLPPPGSLLANMAAGGKAVAAEVDPRDRRICERLAPELRRLGLAFVGLDVIGGFLTEVNVTSPTGLVEIERFTGLNLSARIVDHAIARTGRRERGRRAGDASPGPV